MSTSYKNTLSETTTISDESEFANEFLNDLCKYIKDMQQSRTRNFDFNLILWLLALHNLGSPKTVSDQEILNKACELGREYFTTDWWKADPYDTESMTKEPGNEYLEWLNPMKHALLFAALNRDVELIKELGAWPESWMTADYAPTGMQEPNLETIYFKLFNKYGLNQLEYEESKSKSKRINLLREAIAADSSEEVCKAIVKSLQPYIRKLNGDSSHALYQVIAMEESIVLHLHAIYNEIELPLDLLPKEYHIHILHLTGD